MIRVSTSAVKNNLSKIEDKHLIFKTSIAGMKTCLLIDNKSDIKLIDKFFVYTNKILSFKLNKSINSTFENGKVVLQLIKKIFVNIIIKNYIKQMVCFLADLDMYIVNR